MVDMRPLASKVICATFAESPNGVVAEMSDTAVRLAASPWKYVPWISPELLSTRKAVPTAKSCAGAVLATPTRPSVIMAIVFDSR